MRLPAEWETPAAIWIAWPHNRETWPGNFEPIPEFFAAWARTIAEDTPVRILAQGDVAQSAKNALGTLPANLEIVSIKTNDSWIRDYGPSFVHNSDTNQIEAIDWQYNAWGGKYPPWDADDRAAAQIAQHLGVTSHRSNLCIEGGAIETDGQGRMVAFRDCIETDTRNPDWSEQAIANELYHRLGITEIVWLDGGGLQGDDTDGHIDQLARFVDSRNIVASICDDHSDSNAAGLIANKRQLKLWSGQTDPGVIVHELPIPPARYVNETRVPESYCNFLRIGSSHMLVPTFGSKMSDDRAIGILRDLCPGCDVTGIDCRDIAWGLGALHCASLNQPSPA
ncbi:Putative agmatine deiminase [Planctomycetes bacterium K23_9]|uniref:Agmatine deiminase n=2 Tax=Stieleria marina TaxID=1930275 RepID=A0A517P1V9_9BACT|nr:Putative agmatine deiminase [Planctomycetes bacterium K23_9]